MSGSPLEAARVGDWESDLDDFETSPSLIDVDELDAFEPGKSDSELCSLWNSSERWRFGSRLLPLSRRYMVG